MLRVMKKYELFKLCRKLQTCLNCDYSSVLYVKETKREGGGNEEGGGGRGSKVVGTKGEVVHSAKKYKCSKYSTL